MTDLSLLSFFLGVVATRSASGLFCSRLYFLMIFLHVSIWSLAIFVAHRPTESPSCPLMVLLSLLFIGFQSTPCSISCLLVQTLLLQFNMLVSLCMTLANHINMPLSALFSISREVLLMVVSYARLLFIKGLHTLVDFSRVQIQSDSSDYRMVLNQPSITLQQIVHQGRTYLNPWCSHEYPINSSNDAVLWCRTLAAKVVDDMYMPLVNVTGSIKENCFGYYIHYCCIHIIQRLSI